MFLDYGVTLGPTTPRDKHRTAKSLGVASIFVISEPPGLLRRDTGSLSVPARITLRGNGLRADGRPSD